MTMLTRKALPRRTFLRGVGASLALPLLDAMVPAMTAQARTPAAPIQRLSFVYMPMGSDITRWTPRSEHDLSELSPSLESLAPLVDHVTVLSNMELRNAYPGTHATSNAAFLSAAKAKWTESTDYYLGTTVDQIAAQQIGQETQLPSLELAMDLVSMVGQCDNGFACVYQNNLSWSSPTTPLPYEAHPRIVFERLFGEGGSAQERRAALSKRASLLDWVKDDIARLEKELGAEDRHKVDQYLDSVREVERRIVRAEAGVADNRMPDLERPVGVPAAYADHARLMFDLQVLALQGDVTRVLTFQLARETSTRTYPEIGVSEPHHPLTHHGGDGRRSPRSPRSTPSTSRCSPTIWRSSAPLPTATARCWIMPAFSTAAAWAIERARSRESADPGCRRPRQEGRTAHPVRTAGAAGESAPDVAGPGRGASGQVQRFDRHDRPTGPSGFAGMRMRTPSVVLLALLTAAAGGAAPKGASPAEAAEAGDGARLAALVEQGADVNAAQADGMTALHWAAWRDDVKAAKLLVGAGANAAAANRYGVTPIALAATNGSAPMIRLLLDAGADANTSLPGGETVLMTAARTGDIDALTALLDAGADPNAAEERGQTALMWAAAEGHVLVVKKLIAAGGDFRAAVDSGFTPFFFAVREGRIEVAELLMEVGVGVNEPFSPRKPTRRGPPVGSGALRLAASNAHFELAARLLDAGADPNESVPGYGLLHLITNVRKPGIGDNDPPPEGSGSMSSLELVRKLVEKGADVNARMSKHVNFGNTRLHRNQATPFFLAAGTADAPLLRLLVELGADPSIPNAEGTTPLIAATGVGARSPGEDPGTEEETLEAVELLLELGADVNAVDEHGETPMHGAAYKNLPKVVRLLAERGADIAVWNKPNEFGWTPLVIARGYRFGNFKPSQATVDALSEIMLAAGVAPDLSSVPAKNREIY